MLLTWLQNTTEVGNEWGVFSKPDMLTAQSFEETKFCTLADLLISNSTINSTINHPFLTIHFSQYFEEWTIGENEIKMTEHEEKINNYGWYPESFWIDSNFCT